MAKGDEITAAGVVAIVRLDDLSAAEPLARALIRAGIGAIEFTFTNRRAAGVIERVREAVGDQIAVGAGSVLDPETGRIAILAGAEFLVTPALSLPVIELANRYAIPTVIGAFTPTEIVTAWQAGATYVKVFPATAVGPQYLKDVRGPLPHVRLIPTGGVGPDNAAAFIRAGAAAIAVGSSLVDAKTVAGGNWDVIEERARRLLDIVRDARASAA
ncbi:MAG: bifunctional 4-hydroxy-2-oxoglutarate aldolase/2-dehydro-3-deoxy-phosphogluconate aldolase [Chloroflexota bacterium]|nr:bifunctional 4-hydroxy-2-oxoglutarate aldolase/2-dehydro-3-deoxy-phosphogluconate aldolase [Chloroflexota bacterium]